MMSPLLAELGSIYPSQGRPNGNRPNIVLTRDRKFFLDTCEAGVGRKNLIPLHSWIKTMNKTTALLTLVLLATGYMQANSRPWAMIRESIRISITLPK